MLGHLHGNMARECFKALGLAPAEAFSDDQLVMLWSAHMRYQQLGHVMLDPNPLLAESYSVYMKEVSESEPGCKPVVWSYRCWCVLVMELSKEIFLLSRWPQPRWHSRPRAGVDQ